MYLYIYICRLNYIEGEEERHLRLCEFMIKLRVLTDLIRSHIGELGYSWSIQFIGYHSLLDLIEPQLRRYLLSMDILQMVGSSLWHTLCVPADDAKEKKKKITLLKQNKQGKNILNQIYALFLIRIDSWSSSPQSP